MKKIIKELIKIDKEDIAIISTMIGFGSMLYFIYYKLKKEQEKTPIVSTVAPSFGVRG